jgi:hypothetical protein
VPVELDEFGRDKAAVAAEKAAILARMKEIVGRLLGPLYEGPRRP